MHTVDGQGQRKLPGNAAQRNKFKAKNVTFGYSILLSTSFDNCEHRQPHELNRRGGGIPREALRASYQAGLIESQKFDPMTSKKSSYDPRGVRK
jgi:hypothetical protein